MNSPKAGRPHINASSVSWGGGPAMVPCLSAPSPGPFHMSPSLSGLFCYGATVTLPTPITPPPIREALKPSLHGPLPGPSIKHILQGDIPVTPYPPTPYLACECSCAALSGGQARNTTAGPLLLRFIDAPHSNGVGRPLLSCVCLLLSWTHTSSFHACIIDVQRCVYLSQGSCNIR